MRTLLCVGPGYTCRQIATQSPHPVMTLGRTPPDYGDQHFHWDATTPWPTDVPVTGADIIFSVPTIYKTVPEDDRHLHPIRAALEACKESRSFTYLSSTAVYGNHSGDWVDEDSERRPTSPFGIMRKEIEDEVLNHGGYVVRIVGIYGPGRTLVEAFERGRYKLVNRDKVSNRIHVDDLANIVRAVIEQLPQEKTFIASDGNPIRVGELVDWLQEHVGISPPQETTLAEYESERGKNNADRWKNTIRCKNDRILKTLGIEMTYPSVLDGYRSIFDINS